MVDQFVDTPIGDVAINMADGSNVSIEDIQALFNAQGTKQLLSNYIDGSFTLNNTEFNSFQTEIKNMGYPLQTRNIAISNGNHCGNPQAFSPGATLFSLNGGASATQLTTFLSVLFEPITGVTSLPLAFEFNEPGLIINMLPGSSSFNMDFTAKALPAAGTTAQVYHGNVTFTKKIFSLFGWNPQITVTLTNRSYNNPSQVALSYDYYPGGGYIIPIDFTSPPGTKWYNTNMTVFVEPLFDFIPVPSALDIGKGAVALNNADYLTKYNSVTPPVAPKNSPFINFTTSHNPGSTANEEHISFNTRNADWLSTEIDNVLTSNDLFDCTYVCSNASITGPERVCTSAGFTAPTPSLPYYSWTTTEGSALVNLTNSNTQYVTVTQTGTNAAYSGYVTLQLTYGGTKCGYATVTKRIFVGTPRPTIAGCVDYGSYDAPCVMHDAPYNNYLYYTLSADLGTYTTTSADWQWEKISGNFNFMPQYGLGNASTVYGKNTVIYLTAPNPNGIAFKTRVYTNCGWSEWKVFNWFPPANRAADPDKNASLEESDELIKKSGNVYKVFPNPSNNVVNIELRDENNKPANGSTVSGELFDMMGQSRSKVEIINNKATFSVQGLSRGIYVLKIYVDNHIESQQISIK
ncbi:T9SS type A sorting domain-containing protein [Flavobacterium sp. 3HN19-14]|uniref:T9SS type A sorting domain-containing protein n=1 Tax=Flavobacterium sp. 3HN19-14 TaxID=3448133 RepID=UPI003EE2FF44